MPDLKITQFTAIVTVDNTDVLPIVDLSDNTTKKVTVSQVRALAPVQSLTTTGTSGPSTLVSGVLNVPQYASAPAGSDGQVQYNNGGAFGGDGQSNAGGSGIVIIRYADTLPAATTTTGSPTITVSGGYRYYKWTGSGSVTF